MDTLFEVAGGDVHPVLVHRPWTLADIEEAMTQLLSPAEGAKFADELRIICREFRATTIELRRLLMAKMGNGWTKVSAGYPDGRANPDW